MKLVAISDLHGILPKITENADVLIIAGDISPLRIQHNLPEMEEWLITDFCPWVVSIPIERVILVAGNHDFWFQNYGKTVSKIYNTLELPSDFKITYLQNKGITLHTDSGERVTIFGTPYCHIFGNWPFMVPEEMLAKKFLEIPEGVDILVSHDPPFGVTDVDTIPERAYVGHVGNYELFARIQQIKPKLVICGHIHTGNHSIEEVDGIEYVNVSILNEQYKLTYPPFVYERLYSL